MLENIATTDVHNLILFFSASMCGLTYACYRICVYMIFPYLEHFIWRGAFGGLVTQRWPHLAQSEDAYRPSYRPIQRIKRWPSAGVDRSQLLQHLNIGIGEGMLGFLICHLLPEMRYFISLFIALIILYDIWMMLISVDAARTDRIFRGVRRAAIFFGFLFILQIDFIHS